MMEAYLPPYTMDGSAIAYFKIIDQGNITIKDNFHISSEDETNDIFDALNTKLNK